MLDKIFKNSIYVFIFIVSTIILGCSSTKNINMLIHMMPIQEEYLKKEILSKYEAQNNCKINVINYANTDSLSYILQNLDSIDLVKVPYERTLELSKKELIYSLAEISNKKIMDKINNEYFLLKLTHYKNKPYYIPRKFETRVMVYLKSKVKEAHLHWTKYKVEIDSILREMNNYGIPNKYELEINPEEWDYYDVLIAGYYWKKTDSLGRGKVAHRGKRYSGTVQRLIDRAFQFGATNQEISSLSGSAINKVFAWEAIYSHLGIYNKKMHTEKWSGSGVWKGFKNDGVYLSFMTQLDCFFIHGTYNGTIKSYAQDPEDVAFATIPRAVCFALDNDGVYTSSNSKAISTGGWWWGIPKSSVHANLGLDLALFITNANSQVKGCESFGMIPVRKDVLSNIGLLFGKGWVSNLYDISFKQLVENRYSRIPSIENYDILVKTYLDAWYRISIDGDGMEDGRPNIKKIDEILENEFRNKLF